MKLVQFGRAIFAGFFAALLFCSRSAFAQGEDDAVPQGQQQPLEQQQEQPEQQQQQQGSTFWEGTPGLIRDCSQFPTGAADISDGNLTFLKPINCDSPKVLLINKDSHVVLRSHASISAKNIHFVVEEGASLTITTRGSICFERDEGSAFPLFLVKGKLTLDAGGWMQEHGKGDAVDRSGVLQLSEAATINTFDSIRYSPNCFMVADPSMAGRVDKDGINLMDAPHPKSTNDNINEDTNNDTNDDNNIEGSSNSSSKREFKYQSSSSSSKRTVAPTRRWINRSHAGGAVGESKATPEPLRVGETRLAPIRSKDGGSVWTGTDGSLIHFKLAGDNASSSSVNTGVSGHPTHVRRVVSSDPRKLKDVLRTRSSLEEADETGASLKNAAARGGFCGLGARKRQTKMEKAAENIHQTAMTIDDRGSITVTMDGAPVLSKSGPHKREWLNKFPFRRAKSQRYEMHPTDEGFEVKLMGRVIWELQAADMM